MIIYNQGFELERLNPEKEMELLFNKEHFRANPLDLITIFQTIIQSKILSTDIPLFTKLQELTKEIWYQLDLEKQYYIFNLFNYYEYVSTILEEEFDELNTQLFLSNGN